MARQVGDQVAAVEYLLADRAFLHQLAVLVGPERRLADIDARHHAWPDRAEAVHALDAQHRAGVGIPEIVTAEIVRRGEAGDAVPGLLARDVARHLAEHDRHLALVVHVLVAVRLDQLALVGVERGQRLLEIGRRARWRARVVELVVARDVVHVHAEDLGRRAGRQVHDLVFATAAAVGEDDAAVLELDPVLAAVLDDMPHFPARPFQYAHVAPPIDVSSPARSPARH